MKSRNKKFISKRIFYISVIAIFLLTAITVAQLNLRVSPGETLSAEMWNALIDVVEQKADTAYVDAQISEIIRTLSQDTLNQFYWSTGSTSCDSAAGKLVTDINCKRTTDNVVVSDRDCETTVGVKPQTIGQNCAVDGGWSGSWVCVSSSSYYTYSGGLTYDGRLAPSANYCLKQVLQCNNPFPKNGGRCPVQNNAQDYHILCNRPPQGLDPSYGGSCSPQSSGAAYYDSSLNP